MTLENIAPSGGGEPFDRYADYARAMKTRDQNSANSVKPEVAEGAETMAWGEDGFTFGDILDVINPLQHIPIVSDIYRAITGDQIAPAARMLGGGLLGGIPGLAIAAVNTALQEVTGQDAGEMAIASLFVAVSSQRQHQRLNRPELQQDQVLQQNQVHQQCPKPSR